MSYHVKISEQAQSDIYSIYSYIAQELKAPAAASALSERMEQAILSLSEMPERFNLYPDEPWHGSGLRKMGVANFIVFYIIQARSVVIIRVMYAGRDAKSQLKQTEIPDDDI